MKNNSLPSLFKRPKAKIIKGRMDFILEQCKDKKVLHLGCVDEGLTQERIKSGELLHINMQNIAKDLYGVDISKKGINILKNQGIKNLFIGNVEDMSNLNELKDKNFDLIVAAEIIEHLDNPGSFLEAIKPFFFNNTKMILTTVNAHSISKYLHLLKGRELVHDDHNYWFSWKTLSTLIKKHDYLINEISVYSFSNWNLFKYIQTQMKDYLKSKEVKLLSKIIIIFKTLLKAIFIPFLGLLYKINPFFADGLIFIVTLDNTKTDNG